MKKYYRLEQSLDDNYVVATELMLPLDADGQMSTCLFGREIRVPVSVPLEIDLDRLDGGNPRHYMKGSGIVIISELLLSAFKTAGVDNYQIFQVLLKDAQSKRKWGNYYAFNEIGLVDAVLLNKCKYDILDDGDEDSGISPIYSFDHVVLSQKKLKKSPKMFRLVQDPSEQLYISEDVIDVLRKMSPPEKWGINCKETEIK